MAGTWTCSEDEDFGSIGDRKVIVTGGTSGTPATFADFVTADRAGEAVLLAATACTTNHTLTEQIRPVEDLALQISFILSGTSAGAGDTLDVTGTDWDGNAQSDSIDVSGGDGTYNGSYKWRTITDIDCTGWADGTLRVTQPQWGLIWDYGNGMYRVDGSNFQIGDGSTSTYFQSTLELVGYNLCECNVKANAYLYTGELKDNHDSSFSNGINGSAWRLSGADAAQPHFCDGGTIGIYASYLFGTEKVLQEMNTGSVTMRDSILCCDYIPNWEYQRRFGFKSGLSYLELQDTYINNVDSLYLESDPDVFENVRVFWANTAVQVQGNVTFTGGSMSPAYDNTKRDYYIWSANANDDYTIDVINPDKNVYNPGMKTICDEDFYIQENYTVHIHVNDKDGSPLSGVTVTCEGSDASNYDTEFFSVTTDVNGEIAEQTVPVKKWSPESELTSTLELTNYNVFRITISKTDYETLVIDNITISDAVRWTFELQDEVVYPAVGDVQKDVQYGDGGTEFTGTFEVPAESEVKKDVGYGASGTEYTGTFEILEGKILFDTFGREYISLSDPLIEIA